MRRNENSKDSEKTSVQIDPAAVKEKLLLFSISIISGTECQKIEKCGNEKKGGSLRSNLQKERYSEKEGFDFVESLLFRKSTV